MDIRYLKQHFVGFLDPADGTFVYECAAVHSLDLVT